jgi:hypothetical protein
MKSYYPALAAISFKSVAQLACAFDFPSVVDADDVAYFAHTYDLEGLHWALEGTFNLSHRVHGDSGARPLLASQIARGGGSHYRYISPHYLRQC